MVKVALSITSPAWRRPASQIIMSSVTSVLSLEMQNSNNNNNKKKTKQKQTKNMQVHPPLNFQECIPHFVSILLTGAEQYHVHLPMLPQVCSTSPGSFSLILNEANLFFHFRTLSLFLKQWSTTGEVIN